MRLELGNYGRRNRGQKESRKEKDTTCFKATLRREGGESRTRREKRKGGSRSKN